MSCQDGVTPSIYCSQFMGSHFLMSAFGCHGFLNGRSIPPTRIISEINKSKKKMSPQDVAAFYLFNSQISPNFLESYNLQPNMSWDKFSFSTCHGAQNLYTEKLRKAAKMTEAPQIPLTVNATKNIHDIPHLDVPGS